MGPEIARSGEDSKMSASPIAPEEDQGLYMAGCGPKLEGLVSLSMRPKWSYF